MKSRPKIGEVGELAVPTDLSHAVEFHGDGMPAVVSTPNIIQFFERTARHLLAPHLEADERSVGLEIDIRHLAPTPIGQTIHCRAQVISIDGSKVQFQIEARDAHEVIVRGPQQARHHPHAKFHPPREGEIELNADRLGTRSMS
jgi:predicted thioesterase